MRRFTILATLAAFAVAIPVTALAVPGVQGTPHDITIATEMAAETDLCFACHIPHNAGSEKLWARSTDGTFTGVQNLCHSCHNGVVTAMGANTVMNTALEQHLTPGGDGNCSGEGACHDVHDYTNAKFLAADTTGGNSTCEACHGGSTAAPGFETAPLDHLGVGNHPVNGATFTCNSCHKVHGAAQQSATALLPGGITNAILRADNTSGGYYGAMCVSCHTGGQTDDFSVAWDDPTSPFDYAEATVDGTEQKHPTIDTTAGSTNWNGDPVNGCDTCHDVHVPGSANEWLLLTDNTNSAYCVACHDGSLAPGTASGGASHFVGDTAAGGNSGINSGLSPALPWADQINDNGGGLDYASANANEMVCQTCHSVHRQGQGTWFLRQDNEGANALCSACHSDN